MSPIPERSQMSPLCLIRHAPPGATSDHVTALNVRRPAPFSELPSMLRRSTQLLRTFHSSSRTMGVTVENISAGDGKNFPKKGDTVTIHYVGTLEDGSKFDSSRDRQDPFKTQIGVGRVIKGWDEGVPQLSVGQKANLICTPDYAYGPRGFPPVIPANATLKFEVELIKIN